MLNFLVRLHAVLTTDTDLVAVIPSDDIGASVRQNSGTRCLEYGISRLPRRDPKGHSELVLLFYIHSQQGAAECGRAAEALHKLMTVRKLNGDNNVLGLQFRVARCHLQDTRTMPRNPWASSLRIEYRLHLSEIRLVAHQKQ